MAELTAPEMQPRHMIALVELVTDSVISTPNLIDQLNSLLFFQSIAFGLLGVHGGRAILDLGFRTGIEQ